MPTGEERTAVRTYVPAYQKEGWVEDADDMDMSLSEFVRTMVQAGRRGFDLDSSESAGPAADSVEESRDESGVERDSGTTDEQPRSQGSNPWGNDLETVVLDVCREEPRGFEEIVEEVFADLREEVGDEVNETLQSLQSENRLTHDPMAGGYTVVEGE